MHQAIIRCLRFPGCFGLAWACIAWVAFGSEPQDDSLGIIRVSSGSSERVYVPFSVPLKGLVLPTGSNLELWEVNAPGSLPLPCQIDGASPPQLWSVLRGATPTGTNRVFEVHQTSSTDRQQVRIRDDSRSFTVLDGDRPVLTYNYSTVDPPPGTSDRYRRSGFIHPVWSPSGNPLTEIHPADHIHHLGLWAPWTRTEFDGHEIDFWNLKQGEGTVRFARLLKKWEGPVFGGFQVLQEHVWLKAPEGERVVLNEILTVRVWNLGETDRPQWLLDRISTYRAATDQPLQLKAYRYGGLGFRATALWHNGNSDYLTSELKTRKDGDATRARWCDVYGETPGGIEGIVFMSHSSNRAHPEPVRIWPADSNGGRGDVFFNFCPVRETDWTLTPGKDHVLRYRLHGHTGRLSPTACEQLWRDFTEPPSATFTRAIP